MHHIRGQTVINTTRFVKDHFGDEAHARVVADLPPEAAGMFLAPIRDASWKSLDHTLAYMRAARRRHAPDDPEFFRQMGRFSGRATGASAFRFLIGSDPRTAVSRAAFMWRFLYDAGRVELVATAPGDMTIRIHDFRPSDRAWCERIEGFLEAVMEIAGARDTQVRETACVHLGATHCDMRGTWSPAHPPPGESL